VGASKAKTPDLDDVDSGWEDEEDDEDALDSGWEDPDAAEGPAPAGMTPEEREARTARVEKRKERLRAKATEKAERRKARASAAAAKQKKSASRVASSPSRGTPRRPEPTDDAVAEEEATPLPAERAPIATSRAAPAFDRRRVAPFVVILVVAVGIALYLWKR
jgi:hypothetical protein